jgi:2-aminoadipate transaminase
MATVSLSSAARAGSAPPAGSALPSLSSRFVGVKSSVVRDLLALTQRPGVISFAGGLPAPELFDLDGARASFEAVLAGSGSAASARAKLQYSTTEGNPELRALIAEQYCERDVPTGPDDIVVTTGSQQGLSLLAMTLLDPGDVVLVESPSYLAALQGFSLVGARLVPVPSTDEGVELDALADLAAEHRPKAFYAVPTFHNPTGRTLSASNRAGIVDVAARAGFRVIEDDPYQQLRYSGVPVPSMVTFADRDQVIATGSFSKTLSPGLRLGWVRTTPAPAARAGGGEAGG